MIDYSMLLTVKNFISNSKYSEAHNLLKELLEKEPNDPELRFQEAFILSKDKKTYKESGKILLELTQSEVSMRANIELGKLYTKMEEYDKAREFFYKELNGNLRMSAIEHLGRLEASLKNYDKAKYYFSLLNKTKFRDSAMLELAKIDFAEGRVELARNRFKGLLKTNVAPYANVELGKLEVCEGRFMLAEQYLKDAVNTPIKNIAIYELGRLEEKRKNFDKAREYFESLLDTSNRVDALFEIAVIDKKQGKYLEAEKGFANLLKTKNSERALLELGKLEMRLSDYDKAINHLNAIKANKLKDYASLYLIYIYIKKQKYTSAYKKLKEAVVTKRITRFADVKKFLEYKLKIIGKEELLKKNQYFYNQLVCYSKEKAIEHIKLHLDESSKKRIHTLFNNDVNIEKVYDDCLSSILFMNPQGIVVSEKYIVSLDYIVSNVLGKDTNKVAVVTLPNSKDIITIYPVQSFDEIDEDERFIEEEIDTANINDYRKDMLENMKEVLDSIKKDGFNEIDCKETQDIINDEIIKKLWHRI